MSDALAASGVVGESPTPAGASPGAVPAHVKVAVRIRPLLPTEVVDGSRTCVTHPGRGERYLAVGTGRSQRLFGFDHVFGGDATQAEVYAEIIAPLLDQVVAGCNVGVLAYGQTGSGKTHSLLGARTEEDRPNRQMRRGSSMSGTGFGGGTSRPSVTSTFNAVRSPNPGGGLKRTPSVSSRRSLRTAASFAIPPSTAAAAAQATAATPPPAVAAAPVVPRIALPEVSIDDSAGLLARFVVDLWGRLASLRERFTVRVTASMLELYGEDVLDLLADDVLAFIPANTARGSPRTPPGATTRSAAPEAAFGDYAGSSARPARQREPLSIREDKTRGTVIVGLRSVRIRSAAETLDVLRTGLRNRTTASTVLNDLSSRSHLVFLLQVDGRVITGSPRPDTRRGPSAPKAPAETGRPRPPRGAGGGAGELPDPSLLDEKLQLTWTSKIAFSDLAGSERLTKTQARGIEMKEGIGINSGLLALSNVIAALSANAQVPHVPYRASKLTRILAEYLGGQAVTVFLACLNPTEDSMDETIQTLRYADRAKQIRVDSTRLAQDPTHVHIAQLRKHIALLRLDTVMRHFQISRRDALARLRAAADGKDDEIDRFVVLLHSFVTGWGQLFDGVEDVSVSFQMFMSRKASLAGPKADASSTAAAAAAAAAAAGSRPDGVAALPLQQLSPVAYSVTRLSIGSPTGAAASRAGHTTARSEDVTPLSTGRSIFNAFGDFVDSGAAHGGAGHAHGEAAEGGVDWLSSMGGVGSKTLERLQASMDVQHAEHAVQRHLADLSARLDDLDSRAAVTTSTLSLLASQHAVLRQQLAEAAAGSAEEAWCRRGLLACEARHLQGNAELTALRRAREVLLQQRESDAAEHAALLQRLREHQQQRQLADAPDSADATAAADADALLGGGGSGGGDGGGTDSRMLAQLLARVQRRDARRLGGRAAAGGGVLGQNAACFEGDIAARVRLLAAEDRLVFELTKRADLLRSLEEALRRRRAAEAEATSGEAAGGAGGAADQLAAVASHAVDAAARLRVVDDEVETLDMRLGVVERRVREAAAELRLYINQATGGKAGADDAETLGSEAHVAALADGLSASAAREATADLVLHVCDLRAHLRAAQVQHAASEQALRMVLQESESLRRALRENHAHWATQLARAHNEAADSELALLRRIAGGGGGDAGASDADGGGSLGAAIEAGSAATAIVRRLEALEAENEELRKEQAAAAAASQEPRSATPAALARTRSALALGDSGSGDGSLPKAWQRSATPLSAPPPAARAPRHPFLAHCDAVLGWRGAEAGPGGDAVPPPGPDEVEAALLVRLTRASDLAVQAQDLCADLGLDVAAAVAAMRAEGDAAAVPPLGKGDAKRAISALFAALSRVPPSLLTPAAAVIVLGVCGPNDALPGAQASQSSPQAVEAVPAAPLGTPADIKAMVRARVRARQPPSTTTPVAPPPLPPPSAASGPAVPTSSAHALRLNAPLVASAAAVAAPHLPEDWLLGGPNLAAQALGSLRPGDLCSAALDAAASTLSQLAVIRAQRRSTVGRIVRAVAAARDGPGRVGATATLAPLGGSVAPLGSGAAAAAAAALSLAISVAEDSLPADALYQTLEGLVDAFADEAAGVTRVLDDVRVWRSALGWPAEAIPAAEGSGGGVSVLRKLGRLDAHLWGRLLAWVGAEVGGRSGAASPTQALRGALAALQSADGGDSGALLAGQSHTPAVDDVAMLHAVALALLAAGTVSDDEAARVTALALDAVPGAVSADDRPILLDDLR